LTLSQIVVQNTIWFLEPEQASLLEIIAPYFVVRLSESVEVGEKNPLLDYKEYPFGFY
jgi:sensor domain CHASE-containing protein